MRLSEALLLGSKILKPLPYLRYGVTSEGKIDYTKGCALGMMQHALGTGDTYIEWDNLHLAKSVVSPCECAGDKDIYLRIGSAAAIVGHLFNEHVCTKEEGGKLKCPDAKPWTIEQLADWIESIDTTPKEISQEQEVQVPEFVTSH